jgi:D-alanyl-D-alanine carboxypeptidase (penicillin-binding protein 5/6)
MAIVLGSPEEAFSEAATLLDYGFEAFTERTFVETGGDLGTVEIEGGAVEGVAGDTLTALVPAQEERVRQRIVVANDAVFPPAAGQRIGTLKITLPGVSVGTVPVIVEQVPLPPPVGEGPWWARALGAVGGALGDAFGGAIGST